MQIRAATRDDYAAFERLFPELETGDAIMSREVWTAELMPKTLLCEREGEIAGYIYFQSLDGLGYVRHVVVDPRHRRARVGRALMEEVARRLRVASVETWCLNVKPENVAAIALYEQMGMSLRYASVAMRMGWDIIERLPDPQGAGIGVEALRPADEREVEQSLGLPSGLLAAQRPRTGRLLLVARQGQAIVGVAAFRPEFPGAYPFRAARVEVARALLETMRPDADLSKGFVQLVFEDAPELADAFEAAGGVRHLEIVHLRGPVPAASGE